MNGTNNTFKDGIIKFQSRKRLTLKDLSQMLDKSLSLVGAWRQGTSVTSYDTILKLIEYGMTAQELFGDELANKLILNSLNTAHVIQFVNSPNFQQNEFENISKIIHELNIILKKYEGYLNPKALDYKLKALDNPNEKETHLALWNEAKEQKTKVDNELAKLRKDIEQMKQNNNDDRYYKLFKLVQKIEVDLDNIKNQK